MPGLLSYAGAGLLKGGGDALSEQYAGEVKAKRVAALESLKQKHQRGLLDTRIAADDKRQLRDIDARASLADDANESREFIADGANASRESEGEENRLSREAITVDNNNSRERIAGAKGRNKDTSAAEKRAFDQEVKINTDPENNDKTDWSAVADGLESRGFRRSAKSARRKARAINNQEDTKIAEAQADKEVKERAGTLSSDASDFKDDGGSRAKFRARRVKEIKAELRASRSTATTVAKRAQQAYVGDKPPPGVPGARKFSDGYWYLKRGEQNYRVLKNDAVTEITGSIEEQKRQLAKAPIGDRVKVKGKIYEKKADGFDEIRVP